MPDLVIQTTFADTEGCCTSTACFLTLTPPFAGPYANLAAATTAIANQTSACVGYIQNDPVAQPGTTISAVDGGSSLSITAHLADNNIDGVLVVWGAVSALAGQTISIAWSSTVAGTVGGSPNAQIDFFIYDETGSGVDGGSDTFPAPSSPASGSGTFTSIALPADGTYQISVAVETPYDDTLPLTTDLTITITSSGTMSVCPIRAAYDFTPDYLICT